MGIEDTLQNIPQHRASLQCELNSKNPCESVSHVISEYQNWGSGILLKPEPYLTFDRKVIF